MLCPKCGAQNEEDAKFCEKCGAENHPGRKACNECGVALPSQVLSKDINVAKSPKILQTAAKGIDWSVWVCLGCVIALLGDFAIIFSQITTYGSAAVASTLPQDTRLGILDQLLIMKNLGIALALGSLVFAVVSVFRFKFKRSTVGVVVVVLSSIVSFAGVWFYIFILLR